MLKLRVKYPASYLQKILGGLEQRKKDPDKNLFEGELLSKMAGGPERPHRCHFRRKNFQQRQV